LNWYEGGYKISFGLFPDDPQIKNNESTANTGSLHLSFELYLTAVCYISMYVMYVCM